MSDEYYLALEAQVGTLLADTSNLVAPGRSVEVEDFIRQAEYGVALIWLADLLMEAGAPISPSIRRRFLSIAAGMDIAHELPLEFRADS